MLYLNDAEWVKHGIANDLHRFFVLLWDELLHPETPDTWQVRTSNVRSALGELLDAVHVAAHHEPYRYNIIVLLAEIRAMLQMDPVISRHFPFVVDFLPKIDSAENLPKDLAEIRRQVNVVLGHLRTLRDVLLQQLRLLLVEGNPKNKTDVYKLAMALAVEWVTCGYSVPHLRTGMAVLFDSTEKDFGKRFDAYVSRCDGSHRDFNCRFSVSWPPDVQIDDGIKLEIGRPERALTDHESDFYGQSTERDVFLEFGVQARDVFSARRIGEERIASIFAVLNLYLVQRRFDIKGRYALIWENDQPAVAIPIERSRQSRLQNVEEAGRRVNELLQLRNRLDREDIDQIMSSLQYHRLAMTASTDESCLVNLWIALECLARRGKGSIIETICTQIAPTVAVGNLRKQVTTVRSVFVVRLSFTLSP